jgi:hypothetical protein
MTNKHHQYANNTIQYSPASDSSMGGHWNTIPLAAVPHSVPQIGESVREEK